MTDRDTYIRHISFLNKATSQYKDFAFFASLRKPMFLLLLALCSFLLSVQSPLSAQAAGQRYLVLIGGLGGTPEHKERFQNYLQETRAAFIDRFQFPTENILTLAAPPTDKVDFADGAAKADIISAEFGKLAASLTDQDDVFIILFGHGSFDGKNAMLNIPRRDLKDFDYGSLIATLKARRMVFINTASCSGPFIKQLSAKNRMIITATKSGRQRVDTHFPKFLIEAFQDDAADLNKNGDLDMLEVFKFASKSVENYFTENNLIPTENALLEDTGDGKGLRLAELDAAAEGGLASSIILRGGTLLTTLSNDPAATGLLAEKQQVEEKIRVVQAAKSTLSETAYFAKLEPLFIELALINDKLENNTN